MDLEKSSQRGSIIDLEERLSQVSAQANDLRISNPKRAAELCIGVIEKAKAGTSESRAFINLLAHTQVMLSLIYIQLADYHNALLQGLEANTSYEKIKHDHGISRSLRAVGTANMYMGNYPEALAQLMKGVKICDQIGDTRFKAILLHCIGNLHVRLEDHNKALSYLEKSLEIGAKNGNNELQGELLTDLGASYYHLGDLENSLKYSLRGAEAFEEASDLYGLPKALNAVGQVYLDLREFEKAQEHHLKALTICESATNVLEAIATQFHLGRLYQAQSEYDTALNHLNLALEKALEMESKPWVYRCHRALSETYQATGDHQNALEQFKKFHETKEEVRTRQTEQRMQSLEVMHQLSEAQKDAEIYRLQSANLQSEIEERKKAQAKLEEMATIDPLTGLLNRRHFFKRFEEELDRGMRFNLPLSVVMVDIDHFKHVNDKHGHLVGDQVLIEIGKRIHQSLRKIDVVCRYGGEEFAILLPGTDLPQAELVADRIWQKVADTPIMRNKLEISVSVSLGVANKNQEEDLSIDTLIDHADQALYEAKKSGRNQVKVFRKPELENWESRMD